MSNLRIVGIVIGCIGLMVTFTAYRGSRWKRANFVFLSLFNLALVTVCINPNAVNFLRDLLSLEQSQRGRLIALLVISNIFLIFYSFYARSKTEQLRLQFDRLVRSLGATAMEDIAAGKQRIQPITILIPAYNEGDNLKELLPQIPARVDGSDIGVLVVDDGSDDHTRQTTADLGHRVVSNPINRGGGAALRLGYDILRKAGSRICVTMDADGQHRPQEVKRLVRPIVEGRLDFVIGSRILGANETDNPLRLAGVLLFGKLTSALLGQKITDPSSGFRAFRIEALGKIDLLEDQYHTSELIFEAVKKGLRVGEIPITILKRKHGKSKKGADWKYGIHFARIIFKTWWR